MSKSIPFIIAGKHFPTKNELKGQIQQILNRNKAKEYLSDSDFEFMFEVLKLHPEFELKCGLGVKAMYVKQNPMYKNNSCFFLIRIDNTETDFSFYECLTPTSKRKKFLNACRAAIEPFTQEFKRNFFDNLQGKDAHCPITNEKISYVGSHVDHKPPNTFQNIVEGFINKFSIDICLIEIQSGSVDNEFQDRLADKDLENKWINYHNSIANLRITSGKGNLSLPKE